MNRYTTKSNARRAAIKEAAKLNNLTAAEVKENPGRYFEVKNQGDHFTYMLFVINSPQKVKRQKGAVRRCWDIFEANKGKGLSRSEMIALCVQSGLNYFTGRTQYQQWSTASCA